MSSSAERDQAGTGALLKESRQGFLLSIARIFLFQVVVALALSGAFVAYLNWSSEASFAEFLAATKAQATPNLQVNELHSPCNRSGA